jgi:hypothetical protein
MLTEEKDVLLSLPHANFPIAHLAKARLSYPELTRAFDDSTALTQLTVPSHTLELNRRSSWTREVGRKAIWMMSRWPHSFDVISYRAHGEYLEQPRAREPRQFCVFETLPETAVRTPR